MIAEVLRQLVLAFLRRRKWNILVLPSMTLIVEVIRHDKKTGDVDLRPLYASPPWDLPDEIRVENGAVFFIEHRV